MNILVFGKTGQIATELGICAKQKPYTHVTLLDRKVADLKNPSQCADIINSKKPDIIINAAAYTNVEGAEEEEDLANLINGESPKLMSEAAKLIKSPLIHISTDYVFDDLFKGPKSTTLKPNPLNAYGRSKLLGEEAILNSGCTYVILRTSWVFSSYGSNFVKKILNLSIENQPIGVVEDQIGGPTSAKEIAKACLTIAQKLLKDPGLKGIYHLSGSPDVSWASFAEAIVQKSDKINIKRIKSSSFSSKVIRPKNSCLDCSNIEKSFGIKRGSWARDLAMVLNDLGS